MTKPGELTKIQIQKRIAEEYCILAFGEKVEDYSRTGIARRIIQEYRKLIIKYLWYRKVNTAKNILKRLVKIHKSYRTPSDQKFIEKAEQLIAWIEMPKNIECKVDGEDVRLTQAYQDWRMYVLERDNYHCQECGETKHLCVHHIFSYINHPKGRLDINNGITLCSNCHKAVHKCQKQKKNLA